ncbi:hypothetical protein AB0H60_16410 [Nocardia rhamnosiphila]|uniref:hypothetical protein n=1 Tax=Nocardia rhamnosiphila TaxID=426716 RepID=UPI0033F80BF9
MLDGDQSGQDGDGVGVSGSVTVLTPPRFGMDVPQPNRTPSSRRSLLGLDVPCCEPEAGAAVFGMVGHQVDSVRSPADGVGAFAGSRVVEVAEAVGDALEEVEIAGVPEP